MWNRIQLSRVVQSSKCRYFASSKPSSTTSEFLAKVGRGRKADFVVPVKADNELYSERPEYPPITQPFGRTDPDALKFEKEEFADFVKSLPTVEEKLFAVNPYERPWSTGERNWYRYHMHRRSDPRAIFRISSIPEHYNLLPFYQFITRTHVIEALPSNVYENQRNIDREIEEFVPLANELLQNEQRSISDRHFSSTAYVHNIADQLSSAACNLFGSEFPHLIQSQIATTNSVQAFWIRGGFHTLYPEDDVKPSTIRSGRLWGKELLGDDRRKQGEFAFCLRERLGFSMRNKLPLPEIVPFDDPLCRTPVIPYVYAPLTLGLLPDKDGPTYMTPGYEYGSAFEFNAVQLYPTDTVVKNIMRYKGADAKECYEECLRSVAVSLSFATLLGQAHYLGFTQYNDLTYPLTTQMILTDGDIWYFTVYQLNSISLINHWQESESRSNLIWCSGPMKLYDAHHLNKDVLKWLLKFLLLEPKEKDGVVMRPYLLDRNADENLRKSAQVHANAITSLRQ